MSIQTLRPVGQFGHMWPRRLQYYTRTIKNFAFGRLSTFFSHFFSIWISHATLCHVHINVRHLPPAMYILSLEAEGFRLEGFDGQTPVLLSMDPLLDLGGEEGHSKSTQKKAARNGNRWLLNITRIVEASSVKMAAVQSTPYLYNI